MTEHPMNAPVPLADAEIAQRIAETARAGRPVDRAPTVDQLLAAFGEPADAGFAARARVARALALAGVAVNPPLTEAPPGARVFLDPGKGPRRRGRGRALALGLILLLLVLGAAAAAALLLDRGDDDRASSLPSGTTASTAGTATSGSTSTDGTASTGTDARTSSTTGSDATTPTTTAADEEAAARRRARREAAARREARERRAAAARRRERRAAARRQVTVRMVPTAPTYLCVDDAQGHRLFGGTLSAPRTFKARIVRANIGLDSVTVTVNGKPFPITGSPTGYRFQAGGKVPAFLPNGQRPEC